jgi:putative SOS response-associated peptidase YedK
MPKHSDRAIARVPWLRLVKQLPATFNAPKENVVDKPIFRDAFKRHRCIIPATGYYESIVRPDGKQPYFISAADGGALSFAGLRNRWRKPETGEPVAWCPIHCDDDNVLRRTIHDQMAVLLDEAQFASWLNGVGGTEC